MQFVCNKCKAKYSISAERVQGRVLKIRCRECGEVIEVRGDGLAAGALLGEGGGRKKSQSSKDLSENYKISNLRDRFKESFTAKGAGKLPSAPAVEPRPATKASGETRDPKRWYVSIRNQPVGPVSKTKVKGYLRRNELEATSLVWREGFDDWKPLEKCPELSDLLVELVEQHKPEAAPPSLAPTPVSPAGDLLEPPAEQPVSTGAADDALRGFNLGRIDAQQTVAEVAEAQQALEHDVFRPVPVAARSRPTLVQRLLHSRVALIAGGALAVLIGFGVTLLVVGLDEEETSGSTEAPIVVHDQGFAVDHSERGDILAGLTISLEEVITEELKAEKAMEGEDEGEKKIPGGSKAKVKKTGETGGAGMTGMPDLPFGIKEKSVSSSGSTGSKSQGGAKGQNGLSDTEIRGVVTKNSKTIKKCYEKVLGKGIGVKEDIKVKVRVNVGSSGMVTSAKVIEITNFGNFLTPCIEQGIKGWVFPGAGQPSEFVFPILLTPKQ